MRAAVRAGVLVTLVAAACGALLPLQAERLHASVGGFVVMNCHLDFPFGHQIPYHLTWDKDGESIYSWYSGEIEARVADRWGGRLRRVEGGAGDALGGGSLNVSAVRETDAGLYRCRVSFPNRSPPTRNDGTYYHLDVDGGNLIVTPPTNATVLEGERAEVECLARGPEWEVRWAREGTAIGDLPELAARTELCANGSLVIRQAAAADSGQYECTVRAPDGRAQTAAAHLDVHYKARVVYAPEERHLALGKPASLDCHFSANPPLTNLRWEKDGFLFDPYNVPGVFYSRNGSLLFNQVEEAHEGVYSCKAYNRLGSAGASAGVRVRVVRPPALRVRPHPLYLARLGDTVTLPCEPSAHPQHDPPHVRWTRKDGSPLPEGRHAVSGGNLTLVAVAEEDRGVYVCTASNEAAAASADADLLLENVPPRAPTNLTAEPAARSLHLSWLAGHTGVEVEYQVWYRERGAGEWRTLRLLSLGTTSATVSALRPATTYELRVLAQDLLGDGLFSKPLFVTTAESQSEDDEVSTGAEAGAAAVGVTEGSEELAVTVRLVEGGALVRWDRAPLDESRCTLRWLRDLADADTDANGSQQRLLATYYTYHDHMLVRSVEEGVRYWARVECGEGAGVATLAVPQYGRLRAVAASCAGAALLLAALATGLYCARHRLCLRSPRSPYPPRTPRVHKPPAPR